MSYLFRCLSLTILGLILCASAFAQQTQERTINKESWPNEPVKIAKLKVKGKIVGVGQTFLAEDDWLKGLVVSLKNTSHKPILFAEIELLFPAEQDSNSVQSPAYIFELSYGRMPPPKGAPALSGETKRLIPGDKIEIALREDEYFHIKSTLERLGKPTSIKRVRISIGSIVFDDDTMWKSGSLHRRAPNQPEIWNVVEQPQGSALHDKENHSISSPTLLFIGLFPKPINIEYMAAHKSSWVKPSFLMQDETQVCT